MPYLELILSDWYLWISVKLRKLIAFNLSFKWEIFTYEAFHKWVIFLIAGSGMFIFSNCF